MDSNSNTHQLKQQNQSNSSGLLRFRSAPSSLFSNLTPSADSNKVTKHIWNGSESERFVSNDNISGSSCSKEMNSGYGAGLPPHYPRHGSTSTSSSAMDGSFGLVGSLGMDQETSHDKSFGSNLLRQGSSPAGLFSNISFQNGFSTMKGIGNYATVNGSNSELSPSINRLNTQVSFPSRNASSLGILSHISEIDSEDIEATSPDDGGSNGDSTHYGSGFPYSSWNDTQSFTENLSGLKRGRSSNEKMFSDIQRGGLGNQVHTLSHQLSLPNTSSEMIAMEKLFQFPDSVPCKIRAKRGCATHPRSIAERVRRTKISERMRKLQELVPNMDKQTNTSDMLDLAVDYIKNLQKQFKSLSDKRANCKCMRMQKADTNQIT